MKTEAFEYKASEKYSEMAHNFTGAGFSTVFCYTFWSKKYKRV